MSVTPPVYNITSPHAILNNNAENYITITFVFLIVMKHNP